MSTELPALPVDVADAGRVIAWANEKPRKPANLSFTAGPERQAAYWIEWAQAAEREACAAICDGIARQYKDGRGHAAERAANAIRGQDQKGQG